MGRRGIRDLKKRVGQEWECSISRRRARLYSGGIHVGVQGESHSVKSGDTAGGQLQE